MVKRQFRVVSPDALWRSARISQLNEQERCTLAYLLTSPFSAYTGVFELVPRVSAAEMRISESKFCARIRRLEELGLVATDSNYILVKVWFLHSSWQVYLKPKAKARIPALRAMQRIPQSLIALWRDSTEAAGVPAAIVQTFLEDAERLAATGDEPVEADASQERSGLAPGDTVSVPIGLGIAHNTNNTERPHDSDQNTTPSGHAPGGVDDDHETQFKLELNELAEPHRETVMLEGRDLAPQGRQMLGDELSAHLAAVAAGRRAPINSVRAWLHALAEQIRNGRSIAALGLQIAQSREAEHRRRAAQQRDLKQRREQQALEAKQSALLHDALERCSVEQRRKVLDAALQNAAKTPGRSLNSDARALVMSGRLPSALAGVHVRKALLELGYVSPPESEPAE